MADDGDDNDSVLAATIVVSALNDKIKRICKRKKCVKQVSHAE